MSTQLDRLKWVIKELRHPITGCPWDLKQTHDSLLPFLIEEAYEFVDAVEKKSFKKMEEELGDVLLQVFLHTEMADEINEFSLESVAQTLADKLIRRHPHVFHEQNPNLNPDEVLKQWNEIKKTEKEHDDKPKKKFDDSYLKFPALYSAAKIGKKTGEIGFDWKNPSEVLDVLLSELEELKVELEAHKNSDNKERVAEELGDFLFSAAQLGRHLKISPEDCLRNANKKFLRRFQMMEELIYADGKSFEDMDQAQMDIYWNRVKKDEKK